MTEGMNEVPRSTWLHKLPLVFPRTVRYDGEYPFHGSMTTKGHTKSPSIKSALVLDHISLE